MLKKMKLRTKLLGGFLVVASLCAAVGIYGIIQLGQTSKTYRAVLAGTTLKLRSLADLEAGFLRFRTESLRAYASDSPETRATLRENLRRTGQRLHDNMAAYGKSIDNEPPEIASEDRRQFEELSATMSSYENEVTQPVLDAMAHNDGGKAKGIFFAAGVRLGDSFDKQMAQLTEFNVRTSKSQADAQAKSADAAIYLTWVVIVIVVAAAIVLGIFLSLSITRPMAQLKDAAECLARGDVSQTIGYSSGDEIGAVADSFRTMADTLKQHALAAKAVAAGDVSVTVHCRSEQDVLGKSLELCVANVKTVVAEMERMSAAHNAGDIDATIPLDKFEGAYRTMAEGVNGMVQGHITVKKKAMACVAEFGKGNYDAPLEKFPGKKAFINDNLERLRTNVKSFIAEMERMSTAHNAGDIDASIPTDKFEGAYRTMAEGVNGMVQGHITVKKKAMACIAEFGRGNFDAPLEKFPGKKAFINDTIEQVRTHLKALITDTNLLVQAALEGKLSTRADAQKHGGDFRKIVDGVNATLDAVVGPLQDVGATLDKLAGGDLTAQVTTDFAGDFGKLRASVNALATQVRSAIQQIGLNAAALVEAAEELNKVSQQMSASADETATQANVVSAASEQVAGNVQTVATGADEMGASIKEIAKNTADATRVATTAVKSAESTNETISKLGQSSAEIGQVIKVITSIAQQTNLLALNATIEAARAGEAGKGFAVVANEVKELAKETAKATEDISRKIEAIQSDTKGAVDAIGQIGSVIVQINDIQNTIASAVEEQSATTNEISRNLAEAAHGSSEITKNISGVAEAARSTTAGANDTQKSAQTLERMAAELQGLIAQFKYQDTLTQAAGAGAGFAASSGAKKPVSTLRAVSSELKRGA